MITKYKLAEEVILRLKGIENPNEIEFSIQEVLYFLDQAIGSTIREFLGSIVDDTQEMDGQLTYTFRDVPIKKKGKKYYFEIPATAIALPMGRGIQEVFFSDNEDEVFKPLPSNFNSLYKGLIGGTLDNQISYYQRENEVILKNTNFDFIEDDGCGKLTNVDIRMVMPLNGLKEDDLFIMPPMVQEMLLMKAMQFFSPQQPIDNLNDNI